MNTTEGHLLGRWRVIAERPLLVDFVLALVLAAAVLKAALPESTHRPTGWDVLIAVVAFVAVLGRRRRPMTALAIATTATAAAVVQEVNNPGLIVALGVITYSIAAHTDRRRGWLCALAASSVVYATVVLLNQDAYFRPDVLGVFAWVFLAAAVGDAARSHRAYVREMEDRARRAEQSREDEARRRVTEERLRIARELHDVVAHHIAVINVQAAAATHILDRRPEHVAPALNHIREASNSVLSEIQSVVGVLRGADEPADTEPAPGLSRLPDLLAGLEAAAFPVRFRQLGEPGELPAVADLAAYRIAQEALTNAYKHGAGGARLTVQYAPEAVEVEVVNPLPLVAAEPGSGYGLLGMRERAASAGGSLTVGPAGSDFRVCAVLPAGAPAMASGFGPPAGDQARAAGLLRDIVTGHLASVVEQTRAATRLLESPDLAHLERASHTLLTEVQSVARLLRLDPVARRVRGGCDEVELATLLPLDPAARRVWAGGDEVELTTRGIADEPASGLSRLTELPARLAADGMTVDVQVCGEPKPLSPAADRAAYETVTEAVAGALRHGVRGVRLTVRHRPDAVEIEVVSTTTSGFRMQAVLPVEPLEPLVSPTGSGCVGVGRGRVRSA